MKHFSLGLNIVLAIAVAMLYYLHFSTVGTQKNKAKPVAVKMTDSGNVQPSIAYVELDSLNENISYIRIKRKELEAEQKAIESDWENSYRSMENKKNNFLKKGESITQEMAQEFQGQLMQEQQQVDEKRQVFTQKLNEKSFKFMEDIQKKLKEFLAEYNNERNYTYIFTTGTGLDYMVYKDSSFNITADVIAGMNEKMSASGK